jgi:hypothetical protein
MLLQAFHPPSGHAWIEAVRLRPSAKSQFLELARLGRSDGEA